jgi:AmiR/NasT family two-component response regulator
MWLAANYKREADLPQGAADATRAENQPAAHYYGVSAGTPYLNSALSRALRDRNSAVALRSIKSLQEIVGRQNLFTGNGADALVDAMGSADRLVRYEAAFALAQALPQQSFNDSERVVPLLAEALSQTGTPSVLVVGTAQDAVNKMVDGLKGAGYQAIGATGADSAIGESAKLAAVDVILVSEDADPDRLFATASQNPRLSGASRIVITKTAGSPFAARAVNDRLLSVTQTTDPAALKPVIDQARAKGASLPLDTDLANSYATRAGQLLSNLAISNTQAMDLSAAETSLLSALNDARPDIVKSAGMVLSRLPLKSSQPALLAAASAEKPDDVKIALYKNLAHHAATFGRQIEGNQIEQLEKTVVDAPNLDVRASAAEARGALNLPAEQAKTLIMNQSTVLGGDKQQKPAGETPAAQR